MPENSGPYKINIHFTAPPLPAPLKNLKRFSGPGWYVTGRRGSGFPYGFRCEICKKGLFVDDIVYAYAMRLDDLMGSLTDKVVVQHKHCMEQLLSVAPITNQEQIFEEIKSRVEAGGPFLE